MDKKAEIESIIKHPEYMLTAERRSLQQRINTTKLSGEETKSAIATTVKDKGHSLVSDLFNAKWLDFVCDVADTGDKLKHNLDEAKKIKLLNEYLQKTDNHEKALNSLVDLITDPYGLALYSKVISILSDSPADGDMLDVLSGYLRNLTKEDSFKTVFSRNKTVLSLIGKSSPQALALLKMADKWPLVTGITSYMSNNGHLQGDYSRMVANSFIQSKCFDFISVEDMQMAIIDLQSNGLARLVNGTLKSNPQKQLFKEQLTDLGQIIRRAITIR